MNSAKKDPKTGNWMIQYRYTDWQGEVHKSTKRGFKTKKEADKFYNDIVRDIRGAGIPLTKDKIYGSVSNRKRPVSVFKWVFVDLPVKVKEASGSNIETADVVGMYKIEVGVYKKNRQR